MIRNGKVMTAPAFGSSDWAGFDLAGAMQKRLRKPVKLLNDADVQGLAVIKGKGLELVGTLGTGFGTAWFRDGELMPHMDLAHLVIRRKDDLDVYIGDKTRRRIGAAHWNRRVKKLIGVLGTVFAYDRLYLGGGNSRCVKFKLPRNVSLVSNDAGMEGGAFAWSRFGKS
jgi:polyphosphate glucokinase